MSLDVIHDHFYQIMNKKIDSLIEEPITIDPESTARQIIDVLNQSVSRGGAGSNTALMA